MRASAGRLGALLLGIAIAGCGASPATAPATLPVLPTLPGTTVTPASSQQPLASLPATPAPTSQATATASPTAEPNPTPEDTPEPTRSLAPGETAPPSPADISQYLLATLVLLHLGDASIDVSIAVSDENGDEVATVAAISLESMDALEQAVPESFYVVTFTRPGTPNQHESCRLDVKDGDVYRFVSTDDDIVVDSPKRPAQNGADLILSTSPLCVKAAA